VYDIPQQFLLLFTEFIAEWFCR